MPEAFEDHHPEEQFQRLIEAVRYLAAKAGCAADVENVLLSDRVEEEEK